MFELLEPVAGVDVFDTTQSLINTVVVTVEVNAVVLGLVVLVFVFRYIRSGLRR